VIGQEPITRTLTNALASGRIHHAYLFTGARGVGKTTTARILAKGLNCIKGITTEPCGQCPSCVEITNSRALDVQEIDAATYTKVEDTREVIISTIRIAPARDRHKIFIIDEVHMLSTHSFNALLKTLEEPPPNVVFIMATTDIHKVPETIRSRCQVFEFRTLALGKILDQLRHIADSENLTVSDRALLAIARAGDGSMRDAESALDQVISFAGKEIQDQDVSSALGLVDVETLNETAEAVAKKDSLRVLKIVGDVVTRGYDLRNYCKELMSHFRGLLTIKIAGFDPELTQMSQSDGETLARLAGDFSEQDLLRFFSLLSKTEQDIKESGQARLQLEICLLKLVHATRLHSIEDALNRLSEIEARLGGATGPSSPMEGPRSSPTTPPVRGTGTSRSSASPSRSWSSRSNAPATGSSAPATSQAAETTYERSADRRVAGAERDAEPEPAGAEAPESDNPIARIKKELEAKNKPMILSLLDKSEMSIDGDYLKISYASGDGVFKTQIEARDKRLAIEDACQIVLGRRLSLLVVVGPPNSPDGITRKPAAQKASQPTDNPKLKALVDKFHGEVIEVIRPDQGEDDLIAE
jgi:DNA polymerase-3 subunit gamma/tau